MTRIGKGLATPSAVYPPHCYSTVPRRRLRFPLPHLSLVLVIRTATLSGSLYHDRYPPLQLLQRRPLVSQHVNSQWEPPSLPLCVSSPLKGSGQTAQPLVLCTNVPRRFKPHELEVRNKLGCYQVAPMSYGLSLELEGSQTHKLEWQLFLLGINRAVRLSYGTGAFHGNCGAHSLSGFIYK